MTLFVDLRMYSSLLLINIYQWILLFLYYSRLLGMYSPYYIHTYSTFILFMLINRFASSQQHSVEFHACFAKHNLAAKFVSIILDTNIGKSSVYTTYRLQIFKGLQTNHIYIQWTQNIRHWKLKTHVLYRLEIWPNREIALKQMIKFIWVPPYCLKLNNSL